MTASTREGPFTILAFPAPARTLSMNDRGPWRHRHALTKAWRAAAWLAAMTLNTSPSGRRHGRSWVQVEFPVHDRRRRDPSNWTPTMKAIVDGLVDADVWPDDTPEWVTTTEPFLQIHPRGSGLVRVALTPIELRPLFTPGGTS